MNKFSKTLRDNWIFLLMVLPGTIWLILFFYIPVFGNVVAFKDYHMTGEGFVHSIINSKWVGLDNFKFLFSSKDAFVITRNTVLYNLGFIFIGLIVSVGIAIILSELRSKRMVKIYQTSMLFPYFLSWVIISFFTDAFLNIDKGLINRTLESFGMKGINFYADISIWPFLLLFLGVWKGFGYSSVMYYATIMGIDPTYYEAATVDGASKWQRIRNVIHTYSGYENKVKTTLELKVQSMGLQDVISRILVPLEDEIDEKDGVKKVVKRKIFPGYVLVEMEVNDRSWYVVRNTPGVTGFVGSATKPVPLSDSEVEHILKSQGLDKKPNINIDVEVGETVRITSGAFEDKLGVITELNPEKGTLKLNVEMFNRDTEVEVEFSQIEKAL